VFGEFALSRRGGKLANVKNNRSDLKKRQKGKLTLVSLDVGADLRSGNGYCGVGMKMAALLHP